jgi:protoporphyrinogen/coproporphyrinogen III oxidase
VAVVGGGVSGLAAAHRIHQLLPAAEVHLFEASSRLGGPLDTRRSDGLVLEQGADNFLTRDSCVADLCREVGLGSELLPVNAEHRRALVVCRGRLEPVPDGFVLMRAARLGGVWRSSVLSLAGKLRLTAEPWMGQPGNMNVMDYDESVASFASRRLGREAFERLVEPLLAGIYVADATRLSLAATMPEFLAAEREHGSLRRAWKLGADGQGEPDGADGSGARYGKFLTLRDGLGRFVDALAARLPVGSVRLETPVAALARSGAGRWSVALADGASEEFDGVIVAAPAGRAATMLDRFDPQLGSLLARIPAASSVVVTLVYRPDQIARPLDGFGFVVPRVENRPLIAASFPSVKFAGRGSAERTPIRVFLGGALHPDMIDRNDADLTAIAARELGDLIGARGEPCEAHVARWRESMPQYAVGHLPIVGAIEHRVATHRGLELAGASYRGVGIPQCVRSGREAAERLAALWAAPQAAGR